MKSIFKEYKVEDIALEMGDAPFGSNLKNVDYTESGALVIQGKNVQGRLFNWTDKRFVSFEKHESIPRSHCFPGDLIFPKVGTIGKVGVLSPCEGYEKYILSTNTMRLKVDPQKANPLYIYYYFTWKQTVNLIHAMNSKSVQPVFNFTTLKGFPLKLPPVEIQNEIAVILGGFDDKIALNNQINQTLEAMVQAIFKSWFVDFDPVKAKIAAIEAGEDPESVNRAAMRAISGKSDEGLDKMQAEKSDEYAQLKGTAELFPAVMWDSELGEVPEGWEVVNLKKISKTISKGTTPSKKQTADAEDIPSINFIKVKDMVDDGQINRVGLGLIHESIHKGALKRSILSENDLLFSIAGTIGRVSIVENDLHNSNINQAIAFIRLNDKEHLLLVLEHLKSKRIQGSAIASIVQGVQANVSLTSVGSFQIIIPKDSILTAWNKIAVSLHNEKLERQKQIRVLSNLRDTLLPKFLSGELSVENIKLDEADA